MGKDRPLQIKLDLTDPHKTWFNEIKEKNSLRTHAEAFRYIINIAQQYEQSSSSKYFELHDNQENQIRSYLNRPDFQDQYQVYTVHSFINKALELLFEQLKKEKKSILHWEVKSRLQDEEREIAVAFVECQQASKTGEVRVDDILAYLNLRNYEQVEQVLDSFVARLMLSREIFNNEKVYHAEL